MPGDADRAGPQDDSPGVNTIIHPMFTFSTCRCRVRTAKINRPIGEKSQGEGFIMKTSTLLTLVAGCCLAGLTIAEPANQPAPRAPRAPRERAPAVEKKADADQGTFMGRLVQLDEQGVVIQNRQGKMSFAPLGRKIKDAEGLEVGNRVKVTWALKGKVNRISAIEKIERPDRPMRPAVEAGEGGAPRARPQRPEGAAMPPRERRERAEAAGVAPRERRERAEAAGVAPRERRERAETAGVAPRERRQRAETAGVAPRECRRCGEGACLAPHERRQRREAPAKASE